MATTDKEIPDKEIPVMIVNDGSLADNFFAFHGQKRRRAGDKFMVKESAFSKNYMVRLDQPHDDGSAGSDGFDASEEVDESIVNEDAGNEHEQADQLVENAMQGNAPDPQKAGPGSKKKAATKKKKRRS